MATKSSTVPTFDAQTNQWSYNGNPVRSIDQNEMFDPTTGFIMAAPLLTPADIDGDKVTEPPAPAVDPKDFKVYTQFTFKDWTLAYSPMDTPLLPQKYGNPVYEPTEASVNAAAAIVFAAFPTLTITVTNDGHPAFEFVSPTGVAAMQAAGPIAHSIQKNGKDAAMTSLKATLIDAKVLFA